MKKILAIDGNSIINRAFYGIRPLTTRTGKHTNAIYGMVNMVKRQLDTLSPDYAVAAFDLKEPTFRHKMYEAYKAGRHETPPELLEQFPDAKEILSLMGVCVLSLPGYEADDIQGTVARMGGEDTRAYILSGDRDLLQLIDDRTTVLLATNKETLPFGRAEFRDKYGIEPELFTDMKALMGDSSDNIPGVPGIGEKTAGRLVAEFGSLDDIYASLSSPSISKGVREKLENGRESAYLSKKLATICTDAPIGKTLEEIAFRGEDTEGLRRKYTELEFSAFLSKLRTPQKNTPAEGPAKRADEEPEAYSPGAEGDAETVAVLLCGDGIYINTKERIFLHRGDIRELFPLFDGRCEIVTYDYKTLLRTVHDAGGEIRGDVFDVMLCAYVLRSTDSQPKLESIAAQYLGTDSSGGAALSSALIPLRSVMAEKLSETGSERLFYEVETPLVPALEATERAGFRIDTAGMTAFSGELERAAQEMRERIYFLAGGEFNLNSPKQLGEVLFERLELPHSKKTKSGYSTDAETLERLRSKSPIIQDILDYRQIEKLRGTYASVLPSLADKNGRIHTEFHQALTATGRLSSAEPNLQNIPIRTRLGREMRRFFIPADGCVLVDADYSQIELRLLAHISGDENMIKAFLSGADIHRSTAAAVFGISPEEVTEEQRKRAKAVNFGIVYGIGAFSLAKNIGTSTERAAEYIRSYFAAYPGVEEYLHASVEAAEKCGYTTTLFGRRRYIPELRSQNGNLRAFGKRVAMNSPIQGTAADIMKIAMINTYHRLIAEHLDARIVMQVHDELVIESREEQKEQVCRAVKEEMEEAAQLSVPLTAEVSTGPNWLELEEHP